MLTSSRLVLLTVVALVLAACQPIGAGRSGVVSAGSTVHVSAKAPTGGDGSVTRPFAEVQDAIDVARAGDTIWVAPGTYSGKLRSVRSGTAGRPIQLIGNAARLRHDGTSRLVEIRHDHLVIEGFDLAEANILLVLQGASHVTVRANTFHDAASECVRLRDSSTDNVIAENRMSRCGTESFGGGSKNGEGVYIGTAPERLDENDRSGPDRSDDNVVRDNTITVPAECVDIKEDATGTLVEGNVCSGGLDPNGAGLVSRATDTIFRNNRSTGHVGAGLMLTGDRSGDGTGNTVTGNDLSGNDGYGLKVTDRRSQRVLCGNDLDDNGRAPTTPGAEAAALPC